MRKNKLYENFHSKSRVSTKIITSNNFTYYNLLKLIKYYFLRNKYSNKKIIDIGCGVGAISFYLAQKGFNVQGVDISSRAIRICKSTSKILKLQNKAKFTRVDFSKVNFSQKVDFIICSEVLEHIESDKKTLMEIKKMLKNKGLLILSVPSSNAPLFKLGYAKKFDKKVGHLRRYSTKELKKLLKKTGFKIIEIKKAEGILRNLLFVSDKIGWIIKFIKGPMVTIFHIIDNFLIWFFGESQIFIVARKI